MGINHSNSALCAFLPPLIVVADADADVKVNGNGERIYDFDPDIQDGIHE